LNTVDLHCHTTASDGILAPTELVRLAASVPLDVIAITDHDSTEGVAEALAAGEKYGVEVIPGVELSCDVPSGELHMLGYYPDVSADELQTELQRLRGGRVQRAQAMVGKLVDLGYPISFQRVQELAGQGAIGRPHVAQALQEAGHVKSKGEAFGKLIGRHGPAYVERARLSPADAVRLIRRVGGVPVFAHPFIISGNGGVLAPVPLAESLPDLVAAGLLGIEVYYPYYTPAIIDQLLTLARQYDLIVTGGSDFHGAGVAGAILGSVYVPRKCVHLLQQAHANLSDPDG
jgi:predicted metal-dependent phosphoesterase TrpH